MIVGLKLEAEAAYVKSIEIEITVENVIDNLLYLYAHSLTLNLALIKEAVFDFLWPSSLEDMIERLSRIAVAVCNDSGLDPSSASKRRVRVIIVERRRRRNV